MSTPIHFEAAVRERYSDASQTKVEALCCPVEYNSEYLKVIPTEVIERDYGCGDPSRYLKPGETVLDLGSGTGKICFIAAQVVGANGRVIGVDMNDDMLALARKSAPVVAERIGYSNVEFRKGRIQDLALDLDKLDAELRRQPIHDATSFLAAESLANELRLTHPLVASESVDVVVSNCVLNLVEPRAKKQLFGEIFRVLKNGARAVISDIVSEREVPLELQNDPELWSGCISGALTEESFVDAFTAAGFHGVRILKRDAQPWRVVAGIEFRSLTIEAFKDAAVFSTERDRMVIYKGPFKEVVDDRGVRLERGKRTAVSDSTFRLLAKEPYADTIEALGSQPATSDSCCSGSKCC
jgi:arsenite methyltransferase